MRLSFLGPTYSLHKIPVSVTDAPVSNRPFINPSNSAATGSVRSQSQDRNKGDKKAKAIGKPKEKGKFSSASASAGKPGGLLSDMPSTGYLSSTSGDAPVQPVSTGPVTHPASVSSVLAGTSALSSSGLVATPCPTGFEHFVSTDQASVVSDDDTVHHQSDKESEEGAISDSDIQENNEEMNYQETVRAVFTHIPDLEPSASDHDRSDNPWKGKHPANQARIP